MSDCNCHTEISRDGSGQLQRYLTALDPGYAPIDGRSIEDLLVFAKRYAAQIRFYDLDGKTIPPTPDPKKVNWREFFRRDMAVIAGSIELVDLQEIRNEYDEITERLQTHSTPEIYGALFNPILGMVRRIDRWYTVAIPENPLRADLDLAIESNLRNQLILLRSYAEGYGVIDPLHPLSLDLKGFENPALWGLDKSVTANPAIYENPDPAKRILGASLIIEDIFHAFYSFLSDLVVNKSKRYLDFALEQYPAHQPHMALFIAFLELFKLAQDQLNGTTGRMLDYYYREVLHLEGKPSQPDKAHIIFSLAKDVSEYAVSEGTLLKAGKDSSGKDLIYHTTKEIVVNQAKVSSLKTIFIEKSVRKPAADKPEVNFVEAIYAHPIANSGDGFGADFTDPSKKWPTFGKGHATVDPNNPVNNCEKITPLSEAAESANTQIGFAVASPELLLQSGVRLIYWKMDAFQEVFSAGVPIDIWLTGEKNWVQVAPAAPVTDTEKKALLQSMETFRDFGMLTGVMPEISTYFFHHYAKDANHEKEESGIFIFLPITEQAVVGYDAKLHSAVSFATSNPVMRMMVGSDIKMQAGESHLFTDGFKNLKYSDQSLWVRVGSMQSATATPVDTPDGLMNLVIQTENGIQPINKPFDPFTAFPQLGKTVYFGSEEAFNKPLTQLAVRIDQVNGLESNTFVTSILHNRHWLPAGSTNGVSVSDLRKNILTPAPPHAPGGMKMAMTTGSPLPLRTAIPRDELVKVTEWQPQTRTGFIRLINANSNGDKGQRTDMVASQNKAPDLQIKSVSLSYFSQLDLLEAEKDQCFHVYPFGTIEILSENVPEDETVSAPEVRKKFSVLDKKRKYLLVDAKNRLFPQFIFSRLYTSDIPTTGSFSCSGLSTFLSQEKPVHSGINQYSGTVIPYDPNDRGNPKNSANPIMQEEGMLLIGIENVRPLQSLSLLFEFAEGSADDEDNDPVPAIHWSYLTNNEWRPFPLEGIVSDGTYGFQTTGIVKIDVPDDITFHDTILPGGLFWLMASVTENSGRIPKLIDVVTQAIEVVFEDHSNDQSHFDAALPAGSISKLVTPVSQVSKVTQPFSSFDGKHKEIGREFYTRVSERLRHKDRAINSWDYEHLVLDRFPSVYRVKCITHTDPECLCRTHADKTGCCGPQVAPGHVLLVPISDLKNRNSANPLQPKTSRRTLLAIQDYLKTRTSPFVRVHAKNPVYEQILVAFRVQFYPGVDKGYHLKLLNEEIIRYLTPWAFDEKADVGFGRKVYASSIIRFIEGRPYVDFITDFIMCVCAAECCKPSVTDAGTDDKTPADIMSQAEGCEDWEHLLKQYGKFEGEIVATPSTARSILVSAPAHIILPYEEVHEPTACEKRKLQKNTVLSGDESKSTAKDDIAKGKILKATPVPDAKMKDPTSGVIEKTVPVKMQAVKVPKKNIDSSKPAAAKKITKPKK